MSLGSANHSEIAPLPLDDSNPSQQSDFNVMPSTGLVVDTRSLDELLHKLTAKIHRHGTAISKLPYLEANQSEIRRDLNRLQLNFSSKETLEYATVLQETTNTSGCTKGDANTKSDSMKKSKAETFDVNNLPECRLQSVAKIIEKAKETSDFSTLRDLRNDTNWLKAIVKQMQWEHDSGLSQMNGIDIRLEKLKTNILSIEREVSSSVKFDTFVDLHQNILHKYNCMQNSFNDLRNTFKLEISEKLNNKIVDVDERFKDLNEMIMQRQSALNSRIASFAKASDLNVLQKNTEDYFLDIKNHFSILNKGVLLNEQAIQAVKHHAAFNSINKYHRYWIKKMMEYAWTRWSIFNKKKEEAKSKLIERKRRIRKILLRIWHDKKTKSWIKWRKFHDWECRVEVRRELAIKFLNRRIHQALSEPAHDAFKRWHRAVIIDKISNACAYPNILNRNRDDYIASIEAINEDFVIESSARKYDLPSLLATFKNDPEGANYTLAQEISNIRNYDIGKLRREWEIGKKTLLAKVDNSMKIAATKFDDKAFSLVEKVDKQLLNLKTELPSIKSETSKLRNTLFGTVNRVKTIEESHGERIELLCEGKEIMDDRLLQIEELLRQAFNRIKDLEHEKNKAGEMIGTLNKNFANKEHSYEQYKNSSKLELATLKEEISYLNACLKTSNEEQIKLKESLIKSKNDLIQSKISTKARFDDVHAMLDAHGVQKPKLDKMIEDCLFYEKVAKDKNYVVAINSVNDCIKEVDVTGHIAAFAHDYAAWIAYQADYETLIRLIAGRNPDDDVYTEEDTVSRRKVLLDCLKSDLGIALDKSYPNAGALRLEARMIFLARIIDSVDAVLSKHDQVMMPASTRLGRVRAVIPTCVACDRPLRSRGRKQTPLNGTKSSSREEKAEKTVSATEGKAGSLRPKTTSSVFTSLSAARTSDVSIPPFVMRGGFKMPMVMKSVSPSVATNNCTTQIAKSLSNNEDEDVKENNIDPVEAHSNDFRPQTSVA